MSLCVCALCCDASVGCSQQVSKWSLSAAKTSKSGIDRLRHLGTSRTIDAKDTLAASFLNLGTLLLEFLQLYGRTLCLDDVAISLRNGGYYFSKHSR
jgi:hypothetical protein